MGLHASSLQNPGINAKPDSDWRLDIFCGHTRTHTLHIIGFQNRKKSSEDSEKSFLSLFFLDLSPVWRLKTVMLFFISLGWVPHFFTPVFLFRRLVSLPLLLGKGMRDFFHSNLWQDKISIFTSVNGAWFMLDIRLRELLCYTKHKCYTFEQSQIIG